MRILVTGSAGHLGEALQRTLRASAHETIGIDLLETPFTDATGSIVDRELVRACMRGVDCVLHTATLHKPHVATHARQDFVDTNITGTLHLLEEAASAGVRVFVFTSTTSVFGRALVPARDAPAAWITERVVPVPKNIYGVTKAAAEDLCELFHRDRGLPCLVLRTSRFFPEEDDDRATRETYENANVKVNELLYRRADLADVVEAHLRGIERASEIGFGRYIVSATTPFDRTHLAELRADAPAALDRVAPEWREEYTRRGWRMFPSIDRVYDNGAARRDLGWDPQFDFRHALARLRAAADPRSELARAVGAKGYHPGRFADGIYPVE